MRSKRQKKLVIARGSDGLRKSSKAFTLIEMLVVIVIIGILATIVVVSVSGTRKQALGAKGKAAAVEFQKAIEAAASSGCRTITPTVVAGKLKISCSAPNTTEFATIDPAPADLTYTLTWNGINSTSASGADWSLGSGLGNTSVNKDYTFVVSGYTKNDTSVFTCDSVKGCYCSTKDGCVAP